MDKVIMAALMAVLYCTPAAASGVVELIAFDQPVSRTGEPVIEEQANDIATEMRQDFQILEAGEQTQEIAPDLAQDLSPISSIEIPLWMQTGIAPPRGYRQQAASAQFSLLELDGGCAITPYRPRGDISPIAESRRAGLYETIAHIACEHGLPVALFDALIGQESRYNPNARSPADAMGLAQLIPGTARELGVINVWDPIENMRGGARYLRQQLDEFGRVDLALAAYNSGPSRVRRLGRVPNIAETLNYVSVVQQAWLNMARATSSGGSDRTRQLANASSPLASNVRFAIRHDFTAPSQF